MDKYAVARMTIHVHTDDNKLSLMGGMKIYTIKRFIKEFKK